MVQKPKIRPEDFIYLHTCIRHTTSGGTDFNALCHCKQHKEKVDTLMVNQLAQISERTNLTLDIYTNLVYQIYADNQIIDGIKVYEAEDSEVKARYLPGNL